MREERKIINIACYGQLFFKGKKTGIAWSSYNIIKELTKDDRFSLQMNYFSKGIDRIKEEETRREFEELGIAFNENNRITEAKYKIIWPTFGKKYEDMFHYDADVNLFFNFVVPVGVKGKSIVVVHDMSYLDYPETVRAKTKYWLKMTLKGSVKRADHIITVSEFTKQRLIEFLGIPEEKISVMYNGVDLTRYNPHYTKDEVSKVKAKYGISGDYLLYLGTIEPRKNLERLIKAYYMILENIERDDFDDVPDLILAGGKGWLSEPIYECAKNGKYSTKVKFTGYIDEGDAELLMKGAKLFCFPSLYEGFGMPPLEAMACGTPVLTSSVSSLPEVCGDNAIYVDPMSEKDISEKLEEALKDEDKLKAFAAKGPEIAGRFEWKDTVEPMKKAILDVLR